MATEPTVNEWREAVIDECVINHIGWDENDPRRTVADLIQWECRLTLDPQISSGAQELITKYGGVYPLDPNAPTPAQWIKDVRELLWALLVDKQGSYTQRMAMAAFIKETTKYAA